MRVAALRGMLMRDVPFHVLGLEAIHHAIAVVPAEATARTDFFFRLDVRVARAFPFVEGAPIAGRESAA